MENIIIEFYFILNLDKKGHDFTKTIFDKILFIILYSACGIFNIFFEKMVLFYFEF